MSGKEQQSLDLKPKRKYKERITRFTDKEQQAMDQAIAAIVRATRQGGSASLTIIRSTGKMQSLVAHNGEVVSCIGGGKFTVDHGRL